jgi:acyl-CoA reductase-like NAD-dependent aldehyde dehydrogenase
VMLQIWRTSSFSQRRRLLKIILKFIISNQETICRVSARDSGKAMLDAVMGEVGSDCSCIIAHLQEPQQRGLMMLVTGDSDLRENPLAVQVSLQTQHVAAAARCAPAQLCPQGR